MITESDKNEYDALECKNITLEDFVRQRTETAIEDAMQEANYKREVKQSAKKCINNVLSLLDSRHGSVRRTIVIDGANVMHCGSPHTDHRKGAIQQNIPDVAALLSLIRYFVVRDFDVLTVISRKYAKPGATTFKRAIDELVENNLCIVIPSSYLDDTVALEFAAQLNGVVLTSDLYRDHSNMNNRSRRVVEEHRLNIGWEIINDGSRNMRLKNPEMDYQASKRFSFRHDDGAEMCQNDVIQRLHVVPDQLQYMISNERYLIHKPKDHKRRTVALLNKLITQGVSEIPENVRSILATDVHILRVSNKSINVEPAEIVCRPFDDQEEYIDALEYQNNNDDGDW
ncbi:unnamed protein product [Caenorhabditis nigoni]